MLWYSHDGYWKSTKAWQGSKQVRDDWQNVHVIVPGGQHILYVIWTDGTLPWYRHNGVVGGHGKSSWDGPKEVGNGWQHYVNVLGGGHGSIFAVAQDGKRYYYHHIGYKEGKWAWEERVEIGQGWRNFRDVVAADNGILYGIQQDGTVLSYWYGIREPISDGNRTDRQSVFILVCTNQKRLLRGLMRLAFAC